MCEFIDRKMSDSGFFFARFRENTNQLHEMFNKKNLRDNLEIGLPLFKFVC